MSRSQDKKLSFPFAVKIGISIIASLFIIYIIAGLFILPPLIKPRLAYALSSSIGRDASIEEIRFNPITLSFTVNNLRIKEKDGSPLAGFDHLFVNAQLSSIFHWGLVIKEIRLENPSAVLALMPDGRLSIDDIFQRLSQNGQEPEGTEELPPVIIASLEVRDGSFEFANLTGATPARETFTPISFTLKDLSTLKESSGVYRLAWTGPTSDQYEIDGELSVRPIHIRGSYSAREIDLPHYWSHIRDKVSFRVLKGKVETSGKYSFEMEGDKILARLDGGSFELSEFQISDKSDDDAIISIPSLSAQGISGNAGDRKISIDKVTTSDANIASWLAPDGIFNLQKLFATQLQEQTVPSQEESTSPEATAEVPWLASIGEFQVLNWNAVIEDRTLTEPARFSFEKFDVLAHNISNEADSKADINIRFETNRMGTVKVNGTVGINPPMADLAVLSDQVDLSPFQPYVATAAKVEIAGGAASSEGRLFFQEKDPQPKIRYQGGFTLEGLEILDRVQTGDFIKLLQFEVSGIQLDLIPNRLETEKIDINKPYARITIDTSGEVNVIQAFAPANGEGENDSNQKNLLQRLVNFLIMQIKGPMPINLALVQMQDFVCDFVDDSIQPEYKTRLELKRGLIKGLSSDPSARGDFEIHGVIDQTATIKSVGHMNPMDALQDTRINFNLEGLELKQASPYSGKYIGYKIAQGRLNLNLDYTVENEKVSGDNKIYIDQLTLGKKVNSPDALNLPVALGVALLKDRKGRITLHVPVTGDVKDPKFDFGEAIKSALTGTISDVGSSPFSAIKDMDGFSGEKLRFVEFESGLAELHPPETDKLLALAKFINERPALSLGIEGSAGEQEDLGGVTGQQQGPGEQERTQKRAQEASKQPEEAPAVDVELLKALAETRAEHVRTFLIEVGHVAADRIEVRPAKVKPSPEGHRVELFLSAQ